MTAISTTSRRPSARAAHSPLACPAWTVLLSGFALVAFVAGPLFQYDRGAILGGEWWRAVTGHLTHWSLDHLFWDVIVFAVLGVLNERRNRPAFLCCTVCAAVLISAGLWLFRPDVTHYRGLSGIDSALFVMAATAACADSLTARRGRIAAMAAVALGLFAAKVLWELAAGSALFVDASAAGFETIPLAHALGAAAGAVAGLSAHRRAR